MRLYGILSAESSSWQPNKYIFFSPIRKWSSSKEKMWWEIQEFWGISCHHHKRHSGSVSTVLHAGTFSSISSNACQANVIANISRCSRYINWKACNTHFLLIDIQLSWSEWSNITFIFSGVYTFLLLTSTENWGFYQVFIFIGVSIATAFDALVLLCSLTWDIIIYVYC